MLVGIQDEILRLHAMGWLAPLLADKTTKRNIIWATDAYRVLGAGYERTQEILPALITGAHSDVIKTRARKEMEQQSERTRRHAEVFTPLHICRRMVAAADASYFGGHDPFAQEGHVRFRRWRKWEHYVDARRLEITCGEAPYLVQRYDVATMESVPLAERQGILDRKLRIVSENVMDEDAWMKWALRAYQATYGYEFQGDNLLIARVNLLMTFEEHLFARWRRKPTAAEYRVIVRTIVWNIWQMDGLRGATPCMEAEDAPMELPLFDLPEEVTQMGLFPPRTAEAPPVRIYDWRRQSGLEYRKVNTGGRTMKFDFVIGNPPYQDESNGSLRNYAPPIYHLFLDEAYKIADKVELIHPARFLFNAGSTPKVWNEKMLEDPHLKVLEYEADSDKIFPNLSTPIKGGIVITYRDTTEDYGAIQAFTPYLEMNAISHKVVNHDCFSSLMDVVYSRTSYRLTDTMHGDYPEALSKLSNGHPYDMASNIFQRLPEIFFDAPPQDGYEYIKILGREGSRRIYKYIRRVYVNDVENLMSYKVYVPQATGSGVFGEALSQPIIESPSVAATETFISIGKFDSEDEAKGLEKYIKTKFLRAMLSILKVTQNGNRGVWKMIPLQDFSPSSDIDWSQPIAAIDQQLYAKYGLSEEEIAFIESHVKEMA